MNLRNRPFLFITRYHTPHKSQKTSKAGWTKSPNALWNVHEEMVILDHISSKRMQSCEIIIDILEGKFVKNRHGSMTDISAVEAMLKKYENDVKNGLARWANLHPDNLAALNIVREQYMPPPELVIEPVKEGE